MLTETGRVVAVDDDGLWVETLQQSACAKCSAQKGCGQRLLAGGLPGSGMTFIKAHYSQAASRMIWRVGERAVLGVEENALVMGALIAYGLPLASMLLGMLAGANSMPSLSTDSGAALGALAGLVIGALCVRAHSHFASGRRCYEATVLGKESAPVNGRQLDSA